jgi:hypothetical protein
MGQYDFHRVIYTAGLLKLADPPPNRFTMSRAGEMGVKIAAFCGAKQGNCDSEPWSTLLRAGLAISLTVFMVGFPLPLVSQCRLE